MSKPELDFKSIYEENYSRVVRLCMGYTSGNTDLAKDLTQEVFIKVWDNLKTFRKESNITTWIYRIAVNTCLLNLRKKKSKQLSKVLSTEEIPVANNEHQEKERQYQEMYRCIDALSETSRAIVLMELEGLPQKEIANIMGIGHETVRTRIHRIKIQLSKCVNHE